MTILTAVALWGLLVSLPHLAADAAKPKTATTQPAAKTAALPKVATMSSQPLVKLTPKQEEELIAAMKRSSPDHYYVHLMIAKKGDPKSYQRSLSWMWRKYLRWRDAPKEIQEQTLIEEKAIAAITKLVHSLAQTTDATTRKRLTTELMAAVTKKFDAESALRDYRMEQFKQRLERIRKELDKRKADREKIITDQYELWLKRSQETPPPAKKKSP